MFNALKRAWQRYLASLPPPEAEPPPVSDAAILREMHPPHPPEVQQAFAALAQAVTAHLPAELAERSTAALVRRLRPGVPPAEALAAWVGAHHGPKARNLGLMLLDWKAREEILWQAQRIAKAHGVALDWAYDHETDVLWQGWQARGEQPVSAPLRSLAEALRLAGLVLIVVSVDDTVLAFAVATPRAPAVLQRCRQLGLALDQPADPPADPPANLPADLPADPPADR